MNCESAINLISSRLDHEIAANDVALLSSHLDECAACRATAEAFTLQDAELRTTFESRRNAAAEVTDRLVHGLAADPSGPPAAPRAARPRLWGLAAAALIIGGVAAFLMSHMRPEGQQAQHAAVQGNTDPVLNNGLVPRPRAKPPETTALKVGQTLETPAATKRRASLPDGSIVLVNANSSLRVDDEQHVSLQKGEVFVEVTKRQANAPPFVVKTPTREV